MWTDWDVDVEQKALIWVTSKRRVVIQKIIGKIKAEKSFFFFLKIRLENDFTQYN